jgi:adenine-specific DNA-methyltransferase
MDDLTDLESLPIQHLVEMIREKTGAGVNLSFPGKVLARQLGRRVRPRTMRTVKVHGAGDEDARAKNLLIEGDNLQALASLYREKGQVDLILTDPPFPRKWRCCGVVCGHVEPDPGDVEAGSLAA